MCFLTMARFFCSVLASLGSVLSGRTYNAFVPIFLQDKFGLQPALIGFFMTLDNIAALLIQPAVGAWSDRLRTPIGRRMPFILIGAPIGAMVFGLIPLASVLPLFVACTTTLLLKHGILAHAGDCSDARYHPFARTARRPMGSSTLWAGWDRSSLSWVAQSCTI